MAIYNEKYEKMEKKELNLLQFEKLQATLNRVYNNVNFYKNKFDENNVKIDEIDSLEDLQKLPFTTKDDLKNAYPYNMFAVPLKDIVRIHSSSGTTGKPLVVGYTKNDLKHWAEITARIFLAAGVTKNDLIQIAFHYGLETGAFGLHLGAEKIGASVIPASTGYTHKQIDIMKDYKSTVLVSTPSFALYLYEKLEKMQIQPNDLNLKIGMFGAEPWTENIRTNIEQNLKISSFDNYGLTEIFGPGISFECEKKDGLHINEDHFIVEVINPSTLEPVKEGETGELVFTTINKEGYPLLRYRSGDIAFVTNEPCKCGRTFKKMSRVFGRTDDLIIIKGVKIYPNQIESILLKEKGVLPHYQIIIKKDENAKDSIEIKVEINDKIFKDNFIYLHNIKANLEDSLHTELGVKFKITLVNTLTFLNSEGKTKKIIDLRN